MSERNISSSQHPAPRRPIGIPVHGPGRGHGRGAVERASDAKGTLRRLLGYLRPHRVVIGGVLVLAILSTGMALTGPYLLGAAVDLITKSAAISELLRICLLMIGIYAISWVANSLQGAILATAMQKVMRSLRQELFTHLQILPLSYFDRHSSGDLMSRLTNDIDAISRVLSQTGTQLFTGVLTLAGVLGMMFALNVWLALASLIVFPLMFVLVGFVGKRTRKAYRGYQASLGLLNAHLEETYSGQRVVLAYSQQDAVLGKFEDANEQVRRRGTHAMTYALLAMPLMGILSNANVAILAGLGGWMTVRGLTSIGLIVSFITYSRRFAEPMRQLGNLYGQIQSSLAGAERIFEILDTQPRTLPRPETTDLGSLTGDVEFRNVSFAYEPGVPVLDDVTLRALPGQTVALVGPTGAGKTTIVNLLSRFYEVNDGEILIDGQDIRSITRPSLRRSLGVVLQQTFLFSDTVMENIRYGRLGATDDQVIEAAAIANADRFIRRLPNGYQTRLSERGANLSEGQRQLVAIARAMLADPNILILDEATSSVDTRTELQIQEALLALMADRTSFVIAHRLSTIRNADQIIVIEDGHIVERGSHEELLQAHGAYDRLYQSQFRGQPV